MVRRTAIGASLGIGAQVVSLLQVLRRGSPPAGGPIALARRPAGIRLANILG